MRSRSVGDGVPDVPFRTVLVLLCRGGRLCPPCMTVAPCRAGPMCPAAGYAFFGGARGPRPTGRYVEPRVGDGVLQWSAAEQMPLGYDVPSARHRRAVIARSTPRVLASRREAPRQSVPLLQISAKIATIPHKILCTYPKYGNFAGNGCAGGGGVLYSDRQSHTRGAPQGAPRCFL